jgi:hypothetical protein
MYLSPLFLCLLALHLTSANQIRYPYRTSRRQNGPDDKDLRVNLHPEAAKALSEFLKLDTTTDSCAVELADHPQDVEPKLPPAEGNLPSKRANSLTQLSGGRATARCLTGIGKAVVPALSAGRALEPMVKFVKDVQVNLDFIIYADPEIQVASSNFMSYGANALQSMVPSMPFFQINTLLQSIFAAEYARVVDEVENLTLFSLANKLLERQSDKDTCPKTHSDNNNGMVGKFSIYYFLFY